MVFLGMVYFLGLALGIIDVCDWGLSKESKL